jgi:tetratricopeptide (TPR) repeat protein
MPPLETYTFKHVLVQNAAYESLLRGRRATLHARTVEVLLAQEPGIEDSQPNLLAHHCEYAGNIETAASYSIRAGLRSNYRAAYKESEEQFGNALRLAATLPECEARNLAELRALRGIGLTIGNSKGYASSEFGSHTARAAKLCERVGYPPEFAGIGYGLHNFYVNRSDLLRALETEERLSQWAHSHNDIRGKILSHLCIGRTRMARGELADARSHMTQALELYQSSLDDPTVVWTYRTAISRRVVCHHAFIKLALVSCWTGYPEQALAHISTADEQVEDEVRVVDKPHRLWDSLVPERTVGTHRARRKDGGSQSRAWTATIRSTGCSDARLCDRSLRQS